MTPTDQDVELAARESYGRLLAWLTSRCGSIAMAEDALADALAVAVRKWPEDGVPDNPEAWLLTVARRRLIDEQRRLARHTDAEAKLRNDQHIRLNLEAAETNEMPLRPGIPERRLELMFMCAHPDIPPAMRTPLMLQTVLGLTAEQIGSAMLVAPATIGQRLVRVKRKIVDLDLPFEVPEGDELEGRVEHVLDAIYAAYGAGWEDPHDASAAASGLAGEAIWLAALVVELLPDVAEAKGLYALLCLCESRRPARRDDAGAFVPLEDQDTSLWDRELLESGELALWRAAAQGQAGRYQVEASIQSLHAHRMRSGSTDWRAIAEAYEVLIGQFPTLGGVIGYAASLGRTDRAPQAMALLDDLDADRVRRHQPYWAVRAWLAAELGDRDGAREAYDHAIGLSEDPSVRDWLIRRSQQV